ncbi:MAG: hypothetical protein ABFS41_17825, partial [Myxococcota bacterium]
MSEPYALAPEFVSQPRFTIPSNRLVLRGINWLLRLQRLRFRFGGEVEVRTHTLRSPGGPPFEVLEIAPP